MPHEHLSVLMLGEHGELQLSVLRGLAQAGHVEVHALINKRNRWPPFRFSRHITSYRRYSLDNDSQWLDAIRREVRRTKADVLLAVKEDMIGFLSRHAAHLRPLIAIPPVPTPETLDLVRDKWKLANWLKAHGLCGPESWLCDHATLDCSSLEDLLYPVLLKPRSEFGGRRIQLFHNPSALRAYLNRDPAIDERYMLQNCIAGFDIDCSVLCRNGRILAHTAQTGVVLQKFAYATGIRLVDDARLLGVVRKLVAELNYSGIAHLDFRYDRRHRCYRLIDFNARYWNTLLGSVSAGVNFPYLACLAALGWEFPNPPYEKQTFHLWKAMTRELIGFVRGRRTWPPIHRSEFRFILSDPLPELVYSFLSFKSRIRDRLTYGIGDLEISPTHEN